MITADHLGRSAIVRAADHFYAFVNGWRGIIDGVANGLVWLAVEQTEDGQPITKTLIVPINEVALIEEGA